MKILFSGTSCNSSISIFPHKNNQRKENIVSFPGTLYMYTIQLSEKQFIYLSGKTIFYSYNGGRCIDGINWYRCECAVGFAGPDCRVSEQMTLLHLIYQGHQRFYQLTSDFLAHLSKRLKQPFLIEICYHFVCCHLNCHYFKFFIF